MIGRFAAKRGYDANKIVLTQPIHSASDEVEEHLRAEQVAALGDAAPVWAGDKPCYATPWLADIGEMDAEGQAIIDAHAAERAETDRLYAERQRQSEARARLWADARARHVRLLEAAQTAPTAGEPAEVIAIATDIDRPFPWSALPNGFIVAANGTTVKQPAYYGAPSDQELAINQMIVVAANTAAGLATPVVAAPAEEDSCDLDEEAFVAAIADALRIDAALEQSGADETANRLMAEYLEDNGIAFGDEGFGWDRDAAQLIAEAHLNPEGDLDADEDEVAA